MRPKAAWSPDGSRIAVLVAGYDYPAGAPVLFTMAADGSDVRVIVRGDGEEGLSTTGLPCGPATGSRLPVPHAQFVEWTPDDSRIVFDYGSSIMIVGADGSGLREIVDANPEYDFEFGFHADVSPDGERIVYTMCQYPTGPPSDRRSFGYEIATINLDGSEPQRLTHDENFDHFPVWSPDGSAVLFASGGGWHDSQWFVRDLAPGADPAPTTSSIGDGLPAGEEVYPYPPKRSPGGKRVAFLSAATALYGWSPNGFDADFLPARTDLYVNVVEQDEDAAPVRVSETLGGFAWSPNGDYLALAKPRGDDGIDLAIVAIDGPDEEVLVSYGNPAGYSGLLFIDPVAWSPDGQHIFFRASGSASSTSTATRSVGLHGGWWVSRSASTCTDGPKGLKRRGLTTAPESQCGRPEISIPPEARCY